jgi:hypothetical protein
MEKFVFERKYEDGAWMQQQYSELKRSSKDIATRVVQAGRDLPG